MERDVPYYEKLLEEKGNGTLFPFDEITREQLTELWVREHLPDSMIADLFGVPKSRVTKRRHAFELKMFGGGAQYLEEHIEQRNALAKTALTSPGLRNRLAIGLTHYVFRNGPVEDMHADGKLDQEDMKTLNKFMADRIVSLLYLAEEGRWEDLYRLLNFCMLYGLDWDEPQIDLSDLEILKQL